MGLIFKTCGYCGAIVNSNDQIRKGLKYYHRTCRAAAETEKRQQAAAAKAEKRQQANVGAVASGAAPVVPAPAPPSRLKGTASQAVAPVTDTVQFDFPAAVVFQAAAEGIPTLEGFELRGTSPTARPRQLSATTEASWRSLGGGEKVAVSVSEVDPWKASMSVESAGKLATAATKNRANVEQIIRATSDQLHQNGAEWTNGLGVAPRAASQPESQSIEERLGRLNDLHERGLINEEDFEARKREILSEL